MSALILCQACERHIRTYETSCPFCGARAAPGRARPSERLASARPGGRAALFLAGAVTAGGASSACVSASTMDGEPEDEDEKTEETARDARDGGSTALRDAAAGDGGGSLPVAIYGAPIDRDASIPRAPLRDASADDAGPRSDAQAADAEPPRAVPVYGIPIDWRDSGLPVCDGGQRADAPPPDAARLDAGASCVPRRDAGPMIVPVYGIAPDPSGRPR